MTKQKVLISTLLPFAFHSALAQTGTKVSARLTEFNNDTVRYVKEYIIARKDLYAGKPLDSLLKDLPTPKHYITLLSNKPGSYFGIYLFLYGDRNDRIAQKKDPLELSITWKEPLTKNELTNAGLENWGGEWTPAIYDFFKNRIIGEAGMVKFDF